MPRSRWTTKRLVHLAFMVGRGKSASEIAHDVMIQSTIPAVTDAAASIGLAFCDRPPGNVTIDLPAPLYGKLEAQARTRRQTPADLAGMALSILADDSVLMENVLDDC